MHPISSPSIEGIQLFQSAGQSCMPNNQLQSASTLQSQIDWQKKKKPGWKRASGSGLRWKALLKVNLTLNCFCLFFVHGQREEVRGADRGEVRRTGGEPAPRMQQVDMQRRARPVVSMAQQEQETDRSHTQRGQRSNVYTLVQPQKRCTRTDTHTEKAGNKAANGSQGRRSGCPEISKAAADPPNVIITATERVKETGKQLSLRKD